MSISSQSSIGSRQTLMGHDIQGDEASDITIEFRGEFVHIDAYNFMRQTMRTTININDDILKKASLLTGIKEKTNLVKLGLEALISLESSRRLAKLGATEKDAENIKRRRNL